MEKILLLLYLLFSSILIHGQNQEELEIIKYHQKIYNGLLDENPTPNYLYPIVRADSLLKKCEGTKFESLAFQSLSWYYSYVGEYNKALELDSKTLDIKELLTTKLLDVSKYKLFNAKKEIISESKKYNYILINESHHKPQHRLFVNTILECLYKNDYKILAIEGISLEDTIVNKTKIPTKNLGGLTMEPNFSNLIRDAIKIGYKILPYDYDTDFEFSKRDSLGALRIVKHQKLNQEKVLVFCGYEHIDKSQKSLAYWLQEFTDEKVFSINQTRYSEEYKHIYESPYYQMATSLYSKKMPYVLKKKGKQFKEGESADLFVFHPRTSYESGFASWLIEYDENKFIVPFPKKYFFNIPESSLVQVFLASEIDIGIPIFQFLYSPKGDAKLIIPYGNYVLKIENKNREELLKIGFKFERLNGLVFK